MSLLQFPDKIKKLVDFKIKTFQTAEWLILMGIM